MLNAFIKLKEVISYLNNLYCVLKVVSYLSLLLIYILLKVAIILSLINYLTFLIRSSVL